MTIYDEFTKNPIVLDFINNLNVDLQDFIMEKLSIWDPILPPGAGLYLVVFSLKAMVEEIIQKTDPNQQNTIRKAFNKMDQIIQEGMSHAKLDS